MSPEFHILLVEDSRADVRIIERALMEGGIAHRLTVLSDGQQAIDYLERLRRPDAPSSMEPDLILLDLNLPGIDGAQILTRLKTDPILKVFPVVVLSTSTSDEDIVTTYQAGANTFIQKPAEYPRYRDLVGLLRNYWWQNAHRPGLQGRARRPDLPESS